METNGRKSDLSCERIVQVAVVMTVHNRRQKTERFLKSLERQEPHRFDLQLFITNDGSSDGTSEMLACLAPNAEVLRGDGSLFWAGGMRYALAAARRTRPDFFLLVNDDVELAPNALRQLDSSRTQIAQHGETAILVGSTFDLERACVSYGAFHCDGINHLRMTRVTPSDNVVPADTFNANCVLVPRSILEELDGLEPKFSHGFADIDFGLRARAKGISILCLPGYVGWCPLNIRSVLDGSESLKMREFWYRLIAPKNLPPAEWFLFARRHGGPFWIFSAIGAYVVAIGRYIASRINLGRKSARM